MAQTLSTPLVSDSLCPRASENYCDLGTELKDSLGSIFLLQIFTRNSFKNLICEFSLGEMCALSIAKMFALENAKYCFYICDLTVYFFGKKINVKRLKKIFSACY